MADTFAPAFESFEAEKVLLAGRDSYTFDISLSDHSDIKQVFIRYRGIRTTNQADNWNMSDNLMGRPTRYIDSTYHIDQEQLDKLGMVFYVEATDVHGNTSQTETQYVYRAYGENNPLEYTLPHAGVKVG